MNKIIGLELEAPYRYRAYFVGETPMFNIQNDAFFNPNYGKVKSIRDTGNPEITSYEITFDDGRFLIVNNCYGLILHFDEVEK